VKAGDRVACELSRVSDYAELGTMQTAGRSGRPAHIGWRK
jgi:hypothetical protein